MLHAHQVGNAQNGQRLSSTVMLPEMGALFDKLALSKTSAVSLEAMVNNYLNCRKNVGSRNYSAESENVQNYLQFRTLFFPQVVRAIHHDVISGFSEAAERVHVAVLRDELLVGAHVTFELAQSPTLDRAFELVQRSMLGHAFDLVRSLMSGRVKLLLRWQV